MCGVILIKIFLINWVSLVSQMSATLKQCRDWVPWLSWNGWCEEFKVIFNWNNFQRKQRQVRASETVCQGQGNELKTLSTDQWCEEWWFRMKCTKWNGTRAKTCHQQRWLKTSAKIVCLRSISTEECTWSFVQHENDSGTQCARLWRCNQKRFTLFFRLFLHKNDCFQVFKTQLKFIQCVYLRMTLDLSISSTKKEKKYGCDFPFV